MAKSSFLIRQLLQGRSNKQRAAHAATEPSKRSKTTAKRPVKHQDHPQLTSLVLLLILVMLAGVFLVQSLI